MPFCFKNTPFSKLLSKTMNRNSTWSSKSFDVFSAKNQKNFLRVSMEKKWYLHYHRANPQDQQLGTYEFSRINWNQKFK